MARQLTRLPAGNQVEGWGRAARAPDGGGVARRGGFAAGLRAAGESAFVLEEPRRALRQAQIRRSGRGTRGSVRPGIGSVGSWGCCWILGRMENWLHHRGRGELALCDRQLLRERFAHLVQQGRMVAELTEDFLAELALP